MSKKEIVLIWIFAAGIGMVGGFISGLIAGADVVNADVKRAAAERIETQASFTDKDEATIEFPAVIRGRAIKCVVVVNTRRRASSVFC